MEKVYIILLNYNGWQDTIECLESVFRLNHPNYQVVVVDNCSADNSLFHIRQWAAGHLPVQARNPALRALSEPNVAKPLAFSEYEQRDLEQLDVSRDHNPLILIRSATNSGFACGNNLGIRFARAQGDYGYVWLLNNDTVVDPDCLSHLVQRAVADHARGRKTGLVGGKVLYYGEPGVLQCVSGGTYNRWMAIPTLTGNDEQDRGQYDQLEELDIYLVLGACTLATRGYVEEVGPLGEDYFLYFEEQDWAERGRRRGNWQLGYAWQAKVYHKDGSSTGGNKDKRTTSKLSDYYYSRAKVLFTRKYYPACLPTVYLSFLIVLFNRFRRGKYDHIPLLVKLLLNPSRRYPAHRETSKPLPLTKPA